MNVRRNKITAEQAAEIRSVKSLEPTGETAKRFGLRESTIRLIQTGKIWRADRHQRRIFSDAEVLSMREQRGIRGTARKLAEQYGVDEGAIRRIQDGRTYKDAPFPAERQE